MATLQDCDGAVEALVRRLAELDPQLRSRYVVERTVACRVTDLGVAYSARLVGDGLVDVQRHGDGDAVPDVQVRLATSSDDLLALVQGRLGVPQAWLGGRLKVDASVLDLLRLRTLL